MQKFLPFKPLRKIRLYEEVAEQIKVSIFNGRLKSGDRLPPERELCKIFNVGRPTIREALRTLTIMGLIEVNTGRKGSLIKDSDITQYMDAMREQLSWLIKADEKTIKDLWEVRKYIELGIAHSLAFNGTKSDFEKLDRYIKKMEARKKDIQAYFPIAVEFHKEMALSTKNKVFFLFWEIFHDILLKVYVPILGEIFPEGGSKLLGANKMLLKAIKSRNPDAIDKAMENHASEEKFFGKYSKTG